MKTKEEIWLNGWQIFAIVFIWVSFFFYQTGPRIIETFSDMFTSAEERIARGELIPMSRDQVNAIKHRIDTIRERAWQQIQDSTYTPHQCAVDVDALDNKKDSLAIAHPSVILMGQYGFSLKNICQYYLRTSPNRVYEQYREALDKVQNKKTPKPVDWFLVLMFLLKLYLKCVFCTFLVILVKRYPNETQEVKFSILGDVISISIYSLAPFWGASWYWPHNQIWELANSALSTYRKKYGSEGKHAILAYVFAFSIVMNVMLASFISTMTVVSVFVARAATVIVIAENALPSNINLSYILTNKLKAKESRESKRLLALLRQLASWLVGIAVIPVMQFFKRLYWYLHLQPIRAGTIIEAMMYNAINAPPVFYVLINQNVKQKNTGENNEKNNYFSIDSCTGSFIVSPGY